jgi:hypothetical protein
VLVPETEFLGKKPLLASTLSSIIDVNEWGHWLKPGLVRKGSPMKAIRRLPIAVILLALGYGTANAETIDSVSALVTFPTDGSYSLTLPKFDPTICGAPGCTLTGATLYFFGSDDLSKLTLSNSASNAQAFNLLDTSNLNLDSGNSANSADAYTGEVLDLFDTGTGPGQAQYPTVSGPITLGPAGLPDCPEYTPSATCNSVSYTPPMSL